MTAIGLVLVGLGVWGAAAVGIFTLLYAHGERERAPHVTASCGSCGRLCQVETERYTETVTAGELVTCGGCA